jgi:uncharacterized Zn finger protein (UPF0148 family)
MRISRMTNTKTSKTKTCPKCGTEHTKPGTYCCRACANSRDWTPDQKKVFSEKQKEYMSREESEGHRYKKSIQTTMLLKTGAMGNGLPTERLGEVMTDPDDYFLVPPRDDHDRFVEGGDLWEIAE